ncbi:MAG TPA: YdcF family protein [Nitrospira sp.]|nr:YdcF family protein [Nitrospira sp.]
MDLSPAWFGVYKFAKFAIYPLSWIALAAVVTVFTTFLPVTPRRTTWLRRYALSTALFVLLTATPLLSNSYMALLEGRYPPFRPESSMKFDAIVVLAGGILPKGTLRPVDELMDASRQRTACGATYWRAGLAPRILLSGGDATVRRTGLLESHEMKRWAIELGVPESAILLEDRSRTTYENAILTRTLLGDSRVLLVTDAYHMPRAMEFFIKQGLSVTPAPCGYKARHTLVQAWEQFSLFDLLPNSKALSMTTDAIEEVVGIFFYRLVGKD